MAMPAREQFSASVDSLLLVKLRNIAAQENRDFDDLIEHAIRIFVATRLGQGVREEVMAHFRSSVEKNRELAELLAQHDTHDK